VEIPGTLQSVPHIKRLVQGYREIGLPIIHVIRLYDKMVPMSIYAVDMLSRVESEWSLLEAMVPN